MNILIILPWLPYPYDTGGNQAVFNEINALSNVMNVHLMCFDSPLYREYRDKLCTDLPGITIDLYPKLDYRIREMDFPQLLHKVADKIEEKLYTGRQKNVLCRQLTFHHSYNEHWAAYIKGLIVKYNINIVQAEFVQTLGMIEVIPNSVKTVFVHHQLQYVCNELVLSKTKEKEKYLPLAQRAKAMEIGYLSLYDAVITLSNVDADKLRSIGVSSPIYPSFAIVQNKYKYIKPISFDNRLTFVGPENHNPNKVGITWFLDNIWPKVLLQNPQMRLDIIGNWTKETISDYEAKYDNVCFLGFVDVLADALRGSIMIVPITIGSGIRMKIQEAAQIGIPFITTTVGVEGLPFKSGKDCFITDKEDCFVDCILKLQDIHLQQLFAESANTLVKYHFSLENLQNDRYRIYESIMK